MSSNNALNAPIPFSLDNGGTGASLVASNGGIPYSTASAMAFLAGTATASQMLMSGSSSAPTWSTATWPSTTTANQILYSSATDTVTGLTSANSAVLATTSAGVPGFVGPLTNGQLIVGSTGATPVAATLTAGSGITITNGAGTITISSPDISTNWVVVTGTTQNIANGTAYIANNASQITFTLPTTAAVGDLFSINGLGGGGWKIAQNSGQNIRIGSTVSTTGTGGSINSTNQYDSVTFVCVVANTTWIQNGAPQGNINFI